ncbi:hypothetical protein ASG12_02145 [Williamsia sp. Leaf354]|uniref:hypothetical protein n=1 Tax=Williamsia sp. Leaf354 TaxID=1736349 RepID=UPI0006FB2E96|nr:hypothetical protein [Williamsia sp. Leaf354]KQR99624.1 hypothetical protein ASG12_02145 [Williamsia sp. Leaf354]
MTSSVAPAVSPNIHRGLAAADGPRHFRLRPPAPIRLLTASWDRTHNPPRALSGHVAIEYPITTAVVATRNLYAVTDELRTALEASDLTGFTFGALASTRDRHLLSHCDTDLAGTPRLHTLVLTGRACCADIAPWRCDSLALSRAAATFLWRHDPSLLAFTHVLDIAESSSTPR